jgi:hypothetical protein
MLSATLCAAVTDLSTLSKLLVCTSPLVMAARRTRFCRCCFESRRQCLQLAGKQQNKQQNKQQDK